LKYDLNERRDTKGKIIFKEKLKRKNFLLILVKIKAFKGKKKKLIIVGYDK
jgi:hypothetical protein